MKSNKQIIKEFREKNLGCCNAGDCFGDHNKDLEDFITQALNERTEETKKMMKAKVKLLRKSQDEKSQSYKIPDEDTFWYGYYMGGADSIEELLDSFESLKQQLKEEE